MRQVALLFILGLAPLTACDNADDSNGGGGGSVTQCDFAFGNEDTAKKDFGEGCESDSECAFGVCLKPGTSGNITNSVFGFCTRGCDCENATSSQIPDGEEEVFDCLYPAGAKTKHHIVVQCANLAECQALDPRWTECSNPSSGNARKVCQASPL